MSYFPASDACDMPNSANAPGLPVDTAYLAEIDAAFQSGSDTMCGLITLLGGSCDYGTGTGVDTTGTLDTSYPGIPVVPNTEDVTALIPTWSNPSSFSWPSAPAGRPRRRPYRNTTGFDYSNGPQFLGGPGGWANPGGPAGNGAAATGLTPGDTGDGAPIDSSASGGNGAASGNGGTPANTSGNGGPSSLGFDWPSWLSGWGSDPGSNGPNSGPGNGFPQGNWRPQGWNTGQGYQSAPPSGCPVIVPLTYVIPVLDVAPVIATNPTSPTNPIIPTNPKSPAPPPPPPPQNLPKYNKT